MMINNLKNQLFFISIFSFFLSCGPSKEKSDENIKSEVTNDSQETVIADSILESYRVQETSKKVG